MEKFLIKQNNKRFRMFETIDDSFSESAALIFAGVFVFFLLLLTWIDQQGVFRLASDDSYIYLGYVKQLLRNGDLFSYNVGEKSAGTTGLLYYYLLSLIAFVSHSLFASGVIGNFLTAVTYTTNAVLFLVYVFLFVRIWKMMGGRIGQSRISFSGVLVFSITLLGVRFLWGFFSGLENSLTTCLILCIFYLFLKRSHWLSISLSSACLVTTRPDLMPIGVLIVICGGLFSCNTHQRESSVRKRLYSIVFSVLSFGIFVLIVVSPCWYLTGSPLPSSLGARVTIPALQNPGLLFHNIRDLMSNFTYLTNPWVVGSFICLIIAFAVRKTKMGGVLLGSALLLFSFYMMRGILNLYYTGVQDRYISYTWPLYVLIGAHGIRVLLGKINSSPPALYRKMASAAYLMISIFLTFYGFMDFRRELNSDIKEMNQVVVTPSLWMAENFPPNTRVAMEPAGAIRVFTDLYLIDNLGLTTSHVWEYVKKRARKQHISNDAYYEGFLKYNRVEYVFDYPQRLQPLSNKKLFAPIIFWVPDQVRFSGGTIGVCRVRRELF
ncbi:MAG: hypothetical protein C4522_13490 [Desulfobacteraceae bacterium]|nr:MAG: hypothetical protein C4522_13490 [Desulfobacteraceae bacterium]